MQLYMGVYIPKWGDYVRLFVWAAPHTLRVIAKDKNTSCRLNAKCLKSQARVVSILSLFRGADSQFDSISCSLFRCVLNESAFLLTRLLTTHRRPRAHDSFHILTQGQQKPRENETEGQKWRQRSMNEWKRTETVFDIAFCSASVQATPRNKEIQGTLTYGCLLLSHSQEKNVN